MFKAVMTRGNTITVPKPIREALKLQPGDFLIFSLENNGNVLLQRAELVPVTLGAQELKSPEAKSPPVQNIFQPAPPSLPPLQSRELVDLLVSYFKSGYISKSMIRDLTDASERGLDGYLKTIEKKIQKDVLLLEEADLKRKNISLTNRAEVSKRLEDLLKRSSRMPPRTLKISLDKVWEIIR